MFWDRQNRPIEDTLDWARKFEDVSYRVIAVDQDDPAGGSPMVSTIWQGLDLAHFLHVTDETAMIFETALVVGGHVRDTWLAHSEQEALVQHDWACMNHLHRHSRPEDGLVPLIIERDKEEREKHG